MAMLPNAETALLDVRKLADYCLDPAHPRGRHKARVFGHALGLVQNDAAWLRQAILDGLSGAEAVSDETDTYGVRWRVDIVAARQGRQVVIRTLWIIRTGEAVPRFVTCWVL